MKEDSETDKLGSLFPRICRATKKNADVLLEKSGLHHGQAKLLFILSENDGLSNSEIAEELRISPAAATKVVKRMERSGYVKRVQDSVDDRITRAFLQPSGLMLLQRIRSTFQQVDTVMFADFSEQEKNELKTLLLRILENLHENITDGDRDSP